VEDLDEPGRVALRRHVAVAGGVRRAEEEERRVRDVLAAMRVEMVDLLLPRHLARLADECAQLGDVGDHVVEFHRVTSTRIFITGPPASACSMPSCSAANGIVRLTSGPSGTAPLAASRIASSQSLRE